MTHDPSADQAISQAKSLNLGPRNSAQLGSVQVIGHGTQARYRSDRQTGGTQSAFRRATAMKEKKRYKNMGIFERGAASSRPRLGRQILVSLLPLVLLFAAVGPTRRAKPGASPAEPTIHTADFRATAAVGSADCVVPGFACGANPRGVHVS